MLAKKSEEPRSKPEPQALNATEGYILKSEVAARIQKTPRTVERMMREGLIPYLKIGKGRRATVLFSWPKIQEQFEARFAVNGPVRARGSR